MDNSNIYRLGLGEKTRRRAMDFRVSVRNAHSCFLVSALGQTCADYSHS